MRIISSRFFAILWAALLSSLISIIAAGVWTLLITANLSLTPAIPWAVPVEAAFLWLLWSYLDGRWAPRSTAQARRAYLRARRVPAPVFTWALAASILSLVALAGVWIVLVELTGAGGNPTIPDYSRYPRLTVALGLIMGSLVSPLSEEGGFRGYAQVILERAFPAGAAILLSSLMFSFWHGPTQGFLWPKLLFYFLVGVAFGTTAYFTQSSLPAIPAHILGDLTFFFLIWPFDAARPLVWRDGAGVSFWIALVGAVVFTLLAVWAFRRLARIARELRQPAE
jgi:membrane protease YdiL (CAAX protease family)